MRVVRPAAAAAVTTAALLSVAAIARAQTPPPVPGTIDPVLAFREPADGAALVGEVKFVLRLTPADLAGVELLITVDGRELCTLQRPPWSCAWDAGREMREHHLRAVATLPEDRKSVV